MNTMHHKPLRLLLLMALVLLGVSACGSGADEVAKGDEHAMDDVTTVTNRVDVPAAVRRNLGITFAKVESRDVRSTLRVPGQFETPPEAHRAYHATLSGQVELLVKQYATVKVGDVLFRVDSPEWRQTQKDLADTILAIRRAHAQLEALAARKQAGSVHEQRLRAQRAVWVERLKQVETIGAAGGGIASARTTAQAELAAAETALAAHHEEHAELNGRKAILVAALAAHRSATPLLFAEAMGEAAVECKGAACDLALSRAAAQLGVEVSYLYERVGTGDAARPRWRALELIEVKARHAGIVEALGVTNGAWIHVGDTVLETLDPAQLRFRASGLQADLGRLRPGMQGRVLPPGGGAAGVIETLQGAVTIGIEADPRGRTIDLLLTPKAGERPMWARPGVSTEMEVVVKSTQGKQLAIPLQCVIQDGLDKIIFRRDPKDPDKVIRMKADLGLTDGRWIVVESGVMEGDEIVHAGVYELMLVGGGDSKDKGGHFHADGTYHAEPDH